VTRILIIAAVEAEAAAFRAGLDPGQAERCAVLCCGVGAANAAASTAIALAGERFGAVLSIGIGGAFPAAAPLGALLVADRIVAADLGADGPDGFQSVDALGFGTAVCPALAVPGLEAVRGTLLTVNTATGTARRAEALRAAYPGAVGEAMEGYGVAVAAGRFGLRAAEVRAVSNHVGPRDRAAWRIGPALGALTGAARLIVKGLSQ
jgi:futalosine hydrolase